MNVSFLQVIVSLLAGIIFIILLTVKFKVHPFFALIIACFITGLGVQLPFAEILSLIKNGFGDVMSKLAIIIVLGTTIGVLLEKNGSTNVMAASILKLVSQKRSSLALSVTGFIVGLAHLLRFRLYCFKRHQSIAGKKNGCGSSHNEYFISIRFVCRSLFIAATSGCNCCGCYS